MLNEIKNELLLEKCIRCNNSNDLYTFTWKPKIRMQGRRRKKKVNILFSSCDNCASGFDKFMRLQDYMSRRVHGMLYCLWLLIWFGLIFGILGLLSEPIMGTVGFTLMLVSLIIVIGIYANYNLNSFNPNRFIKIDYYGNITLKSAYGGTQVVNITQEIDKKVQEIKETSHKFCPNCGSNVKTLTGFCKVCGKNLKTIE